jgi:N-sulfoglucosamine sulfohydrolase
VVLGGAAAAAAPGTASAAGSGPAAARLESIAQHLAGGGVADGHRPPSQQVLADGAAPQRRNIVFFLMDDGGFDMDFYGDGHGVVRGGRVTPVLNRLAGRGMVFDRAYTTVSSCSPSRAAILSGLPSHQNGMIGLQHPPHNYQSYPDIISLPNHLREHGWRTAAFGKYHLGPDATSLGGGRVYDFAYGLDPPGAREGSQCAATSHACTAAAPAERGGSAEGGSMQWSRNCTAIKEAARDFLQGFEPEAPFFMYFGFSDPHRCSPAASFCENYGNPRPRRRGSHQPAGPASGGRIPDWPYPSFIVAEDILVPPYLPDTPVVRDELVRYSIAVNRLDTSVGLVLEEIERAGATDDTLLIFTSGANSQYATIYGTVSQDKSLAGTINAPVCAIKLCLRRQRHPVYSCEGVSGQNNIRSENIETLEKCNLMWFLDCDR